MLIWRAAACLLLPLTCIHAQFSMFPAVRGTREMVAAANNFEVEAGYRMLTAGGNAVDAGVAAILAASVTEQARFGIGGEAPLIIKMNGKPARVVSGLGTAPQKATVDYYRNRRLQQFEEMQRSSAPIPSMGIEAAVLPGALDGILAALAEQGTMSFAQVVAPAIEYAEGFPLGEEFALFLNNTRKYTDLWPTSQRFFHGLDNQPESGKVYRLPDLAKTFRKMAETEKKTRGNRAKKIQAVRDLVYRGDIGRRIAEFSEANGGLITRADLAGFHAEWDSPVTGTYRGYEISKPGFWTQGPVMIQALNILETFDLKALGHNTPEYFHTVIEAVKLAFADRDAHYGDPKFSKIPADVLLSKSYAASRARLIDPQKASLEHRPGEISPVIPITSGTATPAQDTTCVNVVDRWGNVFSSTPSGAWLPSVIAGDTGIPFSSRLQSFVLDDGHPNQLAPGKRPRITLSPTLVLKDGRPFFIMSTPGGDNQDQAMLQVLLNIIDFGMDAQDAVEAPRFQTQHFYTSFAGHEFNAGEVSFESRTPKGVIDMLASRGHRISVRGPWSNGSAPTVIKMANGVLEGGADPRRGRFIFGR